MTTPLPSPVPPPYVTAGGDQPQRDYTPDNSQYDNPQYNDSHHPTPTPRPDRGPLIQRLLLVAGAFCVLVAATVYLAVSWRTIGVTGQAGIALGVSALAAAATHVLVRRGLRASAETFAVVTTGLLALDLAGAHHLDVLGVARLPWWTWLTAASGAVLIVSAALAHIEKLTAYRVVAVIALAFLPGAGWMALRAEGFPLAHSAQSGAAIAIAVSLLAIAARIGRRDTVAGGVAAASAAAWWAAAAAAGLFAATSRHTWTDVVPATAIWLTAMVVLLELTRRVLDAGRTGDDRRIVVSVAAPLAAAPGPLIAAIAAAHLGTVATLVVAALAIGVCVWPRRGSTTITPFAIGAVVTAALLPLAAVDAAGGTDLAGGLTLMTAAAAMGIAVNTRGTSRGVAIGGAVLATLFGSALLAVDRAEPTLWIASSWTFVAMTLIIAAAATTAQLRTVLLSAGGAIAAVTACVALVSQTLGAGPLPAVVSLLGAGAALIMFGAIRQSQLAVASGVTAVVLAAIDLAAAHHVDVVEAYTLPLAAALLLAGLLGRAGRPNLSSWAWTSPALVVALLPSTVTTLHDAGVTRLIATAAGALVVVAVGARFRLAAPLVLGALTEIALALSQLAPYAAGAPRWITLAVAGLLLLSLGVAFEAARRGAKAAGRWYAALN